MRIEIPFFAPSQVVKLLERTKKDMNRTGALPGEPYQLVSLSRLCFAMQLFHEKVADTLSDSLGRAIPAVFPLLSPGVCRQVIEVREQGDRVCFRCAIGKKTLHLVVKRRQGQVGNATSINHHQCVGTGKVFWPPYRTKLLRLFQLVHSFSVTTECAVAESPSVAKSTMPSDNPNYVLVAPRGFKGHLFLGLGRGFRLIQPIEGTVLRLDAPTGATVFHHFASCSRSFQCDSGSRGRARR